MTPDGISSEDWDEVHSLALALVNASDPMDERRHRQALLAYLQRLRQRYGELPSILATEADYVNDPGLSESLLLRAYRLAETQGDTVNAHYIALSLADLYTGALLNLLAARKWLSVARSRVPQDQRADAEEMERLEEAVAALSRPDGKRPFR